MKIVINDCYGGYSLSPWALKILGINNSNELRRENPRLVFYVEGNAIEAAGRNAHLRVVEVPSDATDYEIVEYAGKESVVYVKDGHLHWIK